MIFPDGLIVKPMDFSNICRGMGLTINPSGTYNDIPMIGFPFWDDPWEVS
jgi:hypothetical protein